MATHFSRKAPLKQGPRISRRGVLLLALGLFAVVAGSLAQESAVVQLGLFVLLLLLLALFLAWANLRRLEVKRLAPSHVHAMDDFVIELQVINHKPWLDSFSVELEDSLLPYKDRGLAAPWIRSRGGVCRTEFSSRLVRRGVLERASVILRSSFPFGLFQVQEKRRLPVHIVIFPKAVTPKALEHRYESDYLEGEIEGRLTREPMGDLHGIRQFQHGDPLKTIHWPATARSGRVMVRELDLPIPEKYSIIFHSYCPARSFIWPESFETSMELLAGLLYFCARRNVPLDLTASFHGWETLRISDPKNLTEPLTLLARAEQRPETSLKPLLDVVHRLSGRHAVFIFSDTPVGLWAPKLPPLPRPVTCLDNKDIQIRTPLLSFA